MDNIDEGTAEFLKVIAMPDPACRRAARVTSELRRLQEQWDRDAAASKERKVKKRA